MSGHKEEDCKLQNAKFQMGVTYFNRLNSYAIFILQFANLQFLWEYMDDSRYDREEQTLAAFHVEEREIMNRQNLLVPSRRRFLGLTAGVVIAPIGMAATRADDLPAVTNPRSTSGDAVEPNWAERLTITVGIDKADLVGSDEKVLQAAVDYMARMGGGTVHVLPGVYKLRNAVYLQSRVRILGSGGDSILMKEPSHHTQLDADSDWYDQEITLANTDGFRIGDGVCLRAKNPHNSGSTVIKRTLVARSGNRFKLDKALRENLWIKGEPTAATLYPILSGEFISDVVVENITLEGNKENNENLDGNYAGCIWLQDCNRISMRRVTARNYNGDGISWQIGHDVRVEECHSHDNAQLGLHPGSGSQRPLIRNCKSERNDQGIYFCWGVKYGLAEQNVLSDNRSYGVSIGHCDTDNIVRDNEIERSGKVGVLFRGEAKSFAGHRNRIEKNRIVDSGPDTGIGVDIQGETESITIAHNEIRETRQPMSRIGVRIGPKTSDVRLEENRIEGCSVAVSDLRT
jgi:Right handed beta helix region